MAPRIPDPLSTAIATTSTTITSNAAAAAHDVHAVPGVALVRRSFVEHVVGSVFMTRLHGVAVACHDPIWARGWGVEEVKGVGVKSRKRRRVGGECHVLGLGVVGWGQLIGSCGVGGVAGVEGWGARGLEVSGIGGSGVGGVEGWGDRGMRVSGVGGWGGRGLGGSGVGGDGSVR